MLWLCPCFVLWLCPCFMLWLCPCFMLWLRPYFILWLCPYFMLWLCPYFMLLLCPYFMLLLCPCFMLWLCSFVMFLIRTQPHSHVVNMSFSCCDALLNIFCQFHKAGNFFYSREIQANKLGPVNMFTNNWGFASREEIKQFSFQHKLYASSITS